MYFSIKYRLSDILLNIQCNSFIHASYCVNMVSVMSVSRYKPMSHFHPRYQSRSSMYIRSLTPWNFAVLAEAVPIVYNYGRDSPTKFHVSNLVFVF